MIAFAPLLTNTSRLLYSGFGAAEVSRLGGIAPATESQDDLARGGRALVEPCTAADAREIPPCGALDDHVAAGGRPRPVVDVASQIEHAVGARPPGVAADGHGVGRTAHRAVELVGLVDAAPGIRQAAVAPRRLLE